MGSKQAEELEFTGKSLEEALAAAAQSLGVPSSQLSYEVVRNNTRTILGLVRTGEVTVRITAPAAQAKPTVSEVVDRLLSGQDWPARPQQFADDLAEEDEEEDEGWEEEEEEEDLAIEAEEEARRAAERPASTRSAIVAPRNRATDTSQDLETVAAEVVATLLDKMGVFAAVEVAEPAGQATAGEEASPLVLNLVGDDLGILIGRRGETLRDLQFITRLIVSRRMGSWPNLVLDVEGYKSRRTTALRSLAKRMADQVRRTHQPVVLEPMPANERRIVHLALRDDPDVYTESTGEDEARKVQILPKRGR